MLREPVSVDQEVDAFVAEHGQRSAREWAAPRLSALKIIPRFLVAEECAFFRRLVADDSDHRVEQLSTRKRLVFDSKVLSDLFWQRLEPHYPFRTHVDEFGAEWHASGVNNRFRLVRYDTGDQFSAHEDGFWQETWDCRSFATAMVYLNDVAHSNGGSTLFHDLQVQLRPTEGLLVSFLVDGLIHCGEPLDGGQKYLLRTDVMYRLATERVSAERMALFKEAHFCSQLAQDWESAGEANEAARMWQKHFDVLAKLRETNTQRVG